jgi:hypothetical protein
MFALFPILGITQGFIQLLVIITELKIMKGQGKYPNFYQHVASLFYTLLCNIVSVFTTDPKLFQRHRMPCVGYLQLLYYCHPVNGAAYFQAAGNAKKALLLTLSKQGFLNSISTPT